MKKKPSSGGLGFVVSPSGGLAPNVFLQETKMRLVILRTPVGSVVKILSKDRVRVLMSYNKKQRSFRVGFGHGKPEIEFAREFVKVYLVANSKKQEQPARLLSSR